MDSPETSPGAHFAEQAGVHGAFQSVQDLIAELRQRAEQDSERADAAERLLVNARDEMTRAAETLENARREAQSIVDAAHRAARDITEQARWEAEASQVRSSGREIELMSALRTYLAEIEGSQATVLRIAKRALSSLAALEADTVDAGEVGGDPGLDADETDVVDHRPSGAQPWEVLRPQAAEDNSQAGHLSFRGAVLHAEQDQPHASTNRWVHSGSKPASDPITDEHRILDLSNQRDLERLDSTTPIRDLIRGI